MAASCSSENSGSWLRRVHAQHWWLPMLLAAIGFVADLFTPHGVADGLFYLPAALACLWIRPPRVAWLVAGLATLLSVGGHFLSPPSGVPHWIAIFNRASSIVILWIATALITSRKRTEQELLEAKRSAEVATETKSRFLAVVSHDLRQPFQAAALLAGTLERRLSDPELTAILREQKAALSSASSLLNTVLDLAKIESGALKPKIEPVALGPLFETLGTEFRPVAEQNHIRLSTTSDALSVLSDRTWLRQILQNLLANAVRFTHAGGEISLGCRVADGAALINVRDTGIGIPPELLPRVFDEFYQVQNSTPERRGWGLGLSIVSRAAAMLEHTVTVESEVGRGTVFTIKAPIAPESRSSETKEQFTLDSRVQKAFKARVLLIEDDLSVMGAARMLLEAEGFGVDTATDQTGIYQLLQRADFAPDVIISDVHLGEGESGPELVRLVRWKLQRPVPAILVSGDTAMHVKDLGNAQILSKPVDADTLVRTIDQLML